MANVSIWSNLNPPLPPVLLECSSAVGLAEAAGELAPDEEAEEDLLWSLVSESEPPPPLLFELKESSPVEN
jgi:hypothetical protein